MVFTNYPEARNLALTANDPIMIHRMLEIKMRLQQGYRSRPQKNPQTTLAERDVNKPSSTLNVLSN